MNPESVLSWRWDEAAVILSSEAADTVDGEEVATVFDTVVVPASVPETQHASDATSITDNRIRTLTFSGLVCNNDLEARSVAEWTVGRYKDMDTRVQQVTVKPQVDPANLWPVCLGLDLRDAVTVKTAPRGGGDGLNQVVTVEQIAHTITVDRWLVTLGCHPLSSFDTADYWIVGTSDDLGTDTILA